MDERILKNIDNLGRLVIPKPVRNEMGFKDDDVFELHKLGENSVCWNNITKSGKRELPLETLTCKLIEKVRERFGNDENFIREDDGHKYLFDTPDVSVEFNNGVLHLKSVSFRYNYSNRLVVQNNGIYSVDYAFGVDHDLHPVFLYDGFEEFLGL